jgi:hypothetical protein
LYQTVPFVSFADNSTLKQLETCKDGRDQANANQTKTAIENFQA